MTEAEAELMLELQERDKIIAAQAAQIVHLAEAVRRLSSSDSPEDGLRRQGAMIDAADLAAATTGSEC